MFTYQRSRKRMENTECHVNNTDIIIWKPSQVKPEEIFFSLKLFGLTKRKVPHTQTLKVILRI